MFRRLCNRVTTALTERRPSGVGGGGGVRADPELYYYRCMGAGRRPNRTALVTPGPLVALFQSATGICIRLGGRSWLPSTARKGPRPPARISFTGTKANGYGLTAWRFFKVLQFYIHSTVPFWCPFNFGIPPSRTALKLQQIRLPALKIPPSP